MKRKLITQPQADSLKSLLYRGGVVASSEWTNGSGRYITSAAVPPYASKLSVWEASRTLRGEVRKAFDRLVKARPRIERVVAITDLRGARCALRKKKEVTS